MQTILIEVSDCFFVEKDFPAREPKSCIYFRNAFKLLTLTILHSPARIDSTISRAVV
jgi:hypothetical protein